MTAVLVAVSPTVHNVVSALIELYVIILIARALLSWFPIHPGSAMAGIMVTLAKLTEPVLAPLRRILPPIRAGGMAIDLSIIVAIILVQIVGAIVLSYL